MYNVNLKLYSFNELSDEAKRFAIERHRDFLLNTTSEDDFEYPEDCASCIEDIEKNDEYVIDNIVVNDYIYYTDGEMARCITYTGKHPKAGTTEFTLHGEMYIIKR
jgi:hypothetical protein